MSFERFSSNGLQFLAFHPSELSIYADSQGGSHATPHDASEALRNSGAEAVLDGPMFEKGDPSKTYAQQTSGTVSYRHYDLSGVGFPGAYPSRGMTISVFPDGSTQAVSGSAVPPGAKTSVQLYPELVVNGRPASVADNGSASRAALVVLRDGRMAFVVSPSMTMPAFADALADAGALFAGYTDGGGSTSLAATGFYAGSSEHRRVLTWLLVKQRPSAVSGIGLALMIAAAGAVAWWWWKRETHRKTPRNNPHRSVRANPTDSIVRGPYKYTAYWIKRTKGDPYFVVRRYGRDDSEMREWHWFDVWKLSQRRGKLPTSARELAITDEVETLSLFDYMSASELWDRSVGF